jgi:hypothetical protein
MKPDPDWQHTRENTRIQHEFAKVLETKLDLDKTLVKQRLTIDLFEQWNEEGFRKARHVAEGRLVEIDPKNLLQEFKGYPEFPDDSRGITRVFLFFKMSRKLAVEAAIGGGLLLDLIDRDSLNNWTRFFDIVVQSSEQESGSVNQAFLKDVHIIKEFIG